jgi:hypothetical protein
MSFFFACKEDWHATSSCFSPLFRFQNWLPGRSFQSEIGKCDVVLETIDDDDGDRMHEVIWNQD